MLFRIARPRSTDGIGLGCAENDAFHSRPNGRRRTHWAGLKGRVEGAPTQSAARQALGRPPNGQHLCVRRWVVASVKFGEGSAHDLAGPLDYCPDRIIAGLQGSRCHGDGRLHGKS